LEIEALKPREKPYKESDGDSLFVLVQPSGGKLWQGSYRFEGKQKTFSIGPVRKVGPSEARRKWAEARDLIDSGVDPMALKGEAKAAKKAAAAPIPASKTFGMACDEWYAVQCANGDSPKTIKSKANYIRHLKRGFGDQAIDAITCSDVLAFLKSYEADRKLEVRDKVRQVGIKVMAFARVAFNIKNDAFDGDFSAVILKNIKSNLPAFTDEADLKRLFRSMAVDRTDKNAHEAVTLGLQMLALTVVRPGKEFRFMEWSEINFEKAHWWIPAEKMKMRRQRDHVVPLSTQAVAILRKMQAITGGGKYVFSTDGGAKPLAEDALRKRLRFLGFDTGGDHTAHGFRSSFSTVMNGEMDAEHNKVFNSDVIEVQLAHITGGVAGIYKREGPKVYWPGRVKLMQAWADKIDALAAS
jgi:integrase